MEGDQARWRAQPGESLWIGDECKDVGRLTGTGVVDKGLRRDKTKSKHPSQPPLLTIFMVTKTLKAVLPLYSTSPHGKLIKVWVSLKGSHSKFPLP